GRARVLACDRGRVFTVDLPVAENPERTHRLVSELRANAAQRAAFSAAYGQPFPRATRGAKKTPA
ncbi:MAG TPA: hypothetical protein VF768_00050, partial [Holophagaceae bacterium]